MKCLSRFAFSRPMSMGHITLLIVASPKTKSFKFHSAYISAVILREATARMASAAVANFARR